MNTNGTHPRPRVVIVGGGFGGIAAATALRDDGVDVIIVDRRNHHVFQPLLYQVATAGLNASDIAQPIRSMLRAQDNATVVLAEVTSIDIEARHVVLDGRDTLDYDTLILAAGSRHHYFGNDHWSEHAPGLKTIEDALDIRRRIFTAFESAERLSDGQARRSLLTFVIVGGGPTGVELAGALREIVARAMTSEFRSIDPTSARVVLIEGSDRILPNYPEQLSREAERHLAELGVEVHTDCRVLDIGPDGVDTSDGRIDSHTVLWAAGVAASPLGSQLGVPLDRAGRVVVGPDLAVPDHPEILVIGDLAAATKPDGTPVPGVAPAAAQAGRHAAAVVRADLQRRDRPEFHYRDKGSMATIRRSRAVADLGPSRRVSGTSAWILWWLVHLAYLRGIRNRLAVWIGLVYQSATLRREARLITTTATRPDPPSPPPTRARTRSHRNTKCASTQTAHDPGSQLGASRRRGSDRVGSCTQSPASAASRGHAQRRVVNLAAALSTFDDTWAPRTVAEFNGHDIMVVKVQGEFVWHSHANTDDFFLVLNGHLTIRTHAGDVQLNAGDLFVVPQGVEHQPVSADGAELLLIEPTNTPNTGIPETSSTRVMIARADCPTRESG